MADSLLFIKYDHYLLNLFDVERNQKELRLPLRLDAGILLKRSIYSKIGVLFQIEQTKWIDACPSNNNLLAAAGLDKNVKIIDRRESKIVKAIDSIHTGNICMISNIIHHHHPNFKIEFIVYVGVQMENS